MCHDSSQCLKCVLRGIKVCADGIIMWNGLRQPSLTTYDAHVIVSEKINAERFTDLYFSLTDVWFLRKHVFRLRLAGSTSDFKNREIVLWIWSSRSPLITVSRWMLWNFIAGSIEISDEISKFSLLFFNPTKDSVSTRFLFFVTVLDFSSKFSVCLRSSH